MILGNGVVLAFRRRNTNKAELRFTGRVEQDQHGGIVLFDEEGNVAEELGLDRIESWNVFVPGPAEFSRANDPPPGSTTF